MAAPGLSDAAPPRTVERSTSTSCPLSARTTIQLPAMTLTVPRSSVQRGPSPADSGSFTAIDFSAAGGAGVGDSTTRGAAGAEGAAAGGSGAGFAGVGVDAAAGGDANTDGAAGAAGVGGTAAATGVVVTAGAGRGAGVGATTGVAATGSAFATTLGVDASAFGVADGSTLAGKASVRGEAGSCAAGAGAGGLAGAWAWGMSASASAAASPELKAMATISCGLAASVPSTVTRPPALSGPDSRRFAALTSA